MKSRPPLTRERILKAAINVADQNGLDALTMRRLGSELGVEAMSLYKHIANKDDILDGIVEEVVGGITVPDESTEWRTAMRDRAVSARRVLGEHSWAIGLLEARGSNGRNSMRYTNAVLGNLISAGFTIDEATHAFWLLDCYIYGHVVQEVNVVRSSPDEPATSPMQDPAPIEADFPHLLRLAEHASTTEYSLDHEFDFGLDLILDGLERLRAK